MSEIQDDDLVHAQIEKADKSTMRSWSAALFSISILSLVVVCAPLEAKAFGLSEDQQFQLDIDEARVRARDFQKTLDRFAREDAEREQGAKLIGRERVREEEIRERARLDYIRERDNRPSEDEARERMERASEKEFEREAQVMEANRRSYVHKRDRVREVIEKSARIDEKKEYGL